MGSKQRIAIVGCGGIAQQYLSVYLNLDWIEVATCVDAQLERALRAAEWFEAAGKARPRATTNLADAHSRDVQTVIINTPNQLHREHAVNALEAGKHVLLQKPIAANLQDAEAIARAAAHAEREYGVVSGLYMSYFDHPLFHDLRDMVEAGWFGQVAHLYARLMHRGGMEWSAQSLEGNRTWRGSIEQTGGGCFIQLAVHYIHLFEWLMQAKVVRVTAAAKNLHSSGLEGEDLACAILEFENGALATLDTAWCTAGEQFSIHGTKGSAEYLNNRLLSLASTAGAFEGRVVNYRTEKSDTAQHDLGNLEETSELLPPSVGDHTNPLNQQRQFLEAVRDGKPAFVPIESGVDDLRVVKAVYEAAASGKAERLERFATDSFRTNFQESPIEEDEVAGVAAIPVNDGRFS
jgi:UDP-N-acetyl-2-amino-2-deoxyglucuronate dehydrogenase